MKYFDVFFNDAVYNVYIENNVICSDNRDIYFEIEKQLNDRFFKLKQFENTWLFISYDYKLAWIVDINTSYRSLCRKAYYHSIENKAIYLLDIDQYKYLNYRIGRAGSMSILTSFNRIAYEKKKDQNTNKTNDVVTWFDNLPKDFNKNDYIKFLIYRDPTEYFTSQLYFLINQKHSLNKIPLKFRKHIENNNLYFQWLITVYELNCLFKTRDEFHITQQYFMLNDFEKENINIDYIVDLKDIRSFFDNVLKIPYQVSIVRERSKDQTLDKILTDDQIELIKKFNTYDYQLFEIFKDKKYNATH